MSLTIPDKKLLLPNLPRYVERQEDYVKQDMFFEDL